MAGPGVDQGVDRGVQTQRLASVVKVVVNEPLAAYDGIH